MKRWTGVVVFVVISFTSRFAPAAIREPEINGCGAVIAATKGIAVVLPPPATTNKGLRILVGKSQMPCEGGATVSISVENTGRTNAVLPTGLLEPYGAMDRAPAKRERATCLVLALFEARHEHGRTSLPGPPIASFIGCERNQLRTVPPHGKVSYRIRSTLVGPLVFAAELVCRDLRFHSGVTESSLTLLAGLSTSNLIHLR